jgi:uncharacterized protein (DUF362 family)
MRVGPTRRDFLTGAGAAALAGCGRPGPQATPSQVSITRAAYDQSLYGKVRGVFEVHRLDVRGRKVVLKPNLVEFEPNNAINTNPMVVHAAFEALLSMGAASVRIAEGPGHRRNTLDLADAAGYFQTVAGFEDHFTDLNLDDVSRVRPKRQFSRIEKLYLPNTVLGADLLISIPKMKTHHWVGATLSMKNLFGTVPGGVYGWPKNVLHWSGIAQSIADLHALFPRRFALVDGITGMEGNGPILGKPKPVGVLVAGHEPIAVDATCCRIMGIDPQKIGYLEIATEGALWRFDEQHVRQLDEEVSAVATPFELPPGFHRLRLAGRA